MIIEPKEAIPYAFIAESIDRSGQCRATFAPQMGMTAPIPELRERPLLTMKDMGMDHGSGGADMAGMDHSNMTPEEMAAMDGAMGKMDHGSMNMRDPSVAPQVKMGTGCGQPCTDAEWIAIKSGQPVWRKSRTGC